MPLPSKAFFYVCAFLVCLGMARIVFYEGRAAQRSPRRERIDDRYAPLLPFVAQGSRVGFLTDERFARSLDSERYTQALYGLAPRILILDAHDSDVWIADLIDPSTLSTFMAQRGLEPTAILDDGRLALLRRKQAR